MRFYRESLLGGIRDQTVATNPNLKIRKYFESSDLALVFQELYMNYVRAEVNDAFDEKECFLFPIDVNAELLCLSPTGLVKILAKFGSDAHNLILTRKKTREGTWIKINWRKFRRIISNNSKNTFEEINKRHRIKKQEEIELAESSPEVDEIYTLWQETSAKVSKPKKLNDGLRMTIAKSLDKLGSDKIKEAINNLEVATTSECVTRWYSTKWGLKKFLEQSNGVPNWVEDNWDASSMNPDNQAQEAQDMVVKDKDFVHGDDDIKGVIKAFNKTIDYIEDYNDKDINRKTFTAVKDFFNSWETACGKVFEEVDNEYGTFDIDKYGQAAEEDADNALYNCLTAPTLIKNYKSYLELKVLTKSRGDRIPLNALDFDWSSTHIKGFIDYYKRSGAANAESIKHVEHFLKIIMNRKRREE